ncbi:circularly permuted type 2 ATP-grasp protein [Lichenifustis flavocetrariae]|uniref:Circularly permuted type 2 ATP-grasp protein n=1 Tax=Lichenifustis flavocetrariae TaxID=2949735 RepID=A0AA41YUQ3_9HYPH|nr:circularly permuted type 2 ATP-grasp protein [Lichenifustis flavocetrariae]MCW6508484.1 circularly permuted type 2 ATP-grasp protein [Lichenifustis flavocetrariae]
MIEAYEPLPGVLDECVDRDGRIRPHWRRFFELFTALPSAELMRRVASADRHMRDTGVTYRTYGDADDRPWPISPVPLLIDAAEWSTIAAGVAQRARLAEAVLADVFGPSRLVREGLLPAAAVAGSPDFLHPAVGVMPTGHRFLSLYAVDLGRGPDGRWWVLGDRTQAPSGAGYALENRLALSRAFADLYGSMNIERLAPFFQAFRDGLSQLAERVEPRICLWTPGPLSETYFEHAYLARYLGFLLVEGGDLVVRDEQVHIRTVAGLKRADVLLRRVDADYADPLELNGRSRLGVAGLMEAVRGGRVAIANALGAGLVEGRALMSFLPQLAQPTIAEDLLLPSLATFWGGTKAGHEAAVERLDTMVSGAFRERIPGLGLDRPTLGGELSSEQRVHLRRLMQDRAIDYAAQDVARLSTTPVWDGTRFVPRPFVLRVFAAATADGWRVMPGGFCRVASRADATAISMSTGVQSADVWVLADQPVESVTLLPSSGTVRIRRLLGNLPSRAADNLFWLGRYLERTEGTLRIVRCLSGRMIEACGRGQAGGLTLALGKLVDLLVRWGALSPGPPGGAARLQSAVYDPDRFGSALALAREVRRTASTIRERLSVDTTRLIHDLVTHLSVPMAEQAREADLFEGADRALQLIAAISGLGQENVNRVAGWRFLEMGRRIERAVATCRFARSFAGEPGPAESLDVLLDLIDSQITYRSRYLIGVALAPIRDMALLDPYNPRSVTFQIDRLAEHLAALPVLRGDGLIERPHSLVRQVATFVATTDAHSVDGAVIDRIEGDVMALSGAIADRYFLQGASAARADKWTGLG